MTTLREAIRRIPAADLKWLRRLAPADRFDELLRRRAEGVPVQHLLGAWSFRQIELCCDRRALIPRPETEWLVEVALGEVPPGATVADIGTGTGCIALSIKHERPDCRVIATDSSPGALELAGDNAVSLGLDVELRQGDLYEALTGPDRNAINVVVSNPPYLATHEHAALPVEVRDHDPRAALVAGPLGTEVLDRLIAGRPAAATLICEIAPHQAAWARERGATQVQNDLGGRERIAIFEPAPGE